MPRRNRPRSQSNLQPHDNSYKPLKINNKEILGLDTAGRQAHIVHIMSGKSQKEYLCPGCHRIIPEGMAHVVAWSAECFNGLDERRHWHTSCWQKYGSVII